MKRPNEAVIRLAQIRVAVRQNPMCAEDYITTALIDLLPPRHQQTLKLLEAATNVTADELHLALNIQINHASMLLNELHGLNLLTRQKRTDDTGRYFVYNHWNKGGAS